MSLACARATPAAPVQLNIGVRQRLEVGGLFAALLACLAGGGYLIKRARGLAKTGEGHDWELGGAFVILMFCGFLSIYLWVPPFANLMKKLWPDGELVMAVVLIPLMIWVIFGLPARIVYGPDKDDDA